MKVGDNTKDENCKGISDYMKVSNSRKDANYMKDANCYTEIHRGISAPLNDRRDTQRQFGTAQ